jgi:hypothetical protein
MYENGRIRYGSRFLRQQEKQRRPLYHPDFNQALAL